MGYKELTVLLSHHFRSGFWKIKTNMRTLVFWSGKPKNISKVLLRDTVVQGAAVIRKGYSCFWEGY